MGKHRNKHHRQHESRVPAEPPDVSLIDTPPLPSDTSLDNDPAAANQHPETLANIPSLSTGIALGWSAPAVPVLLGQVEGDAPLLRLSLEQASWVGAMLPLASLAGALVAGPLAERLGRKRALLLCAVPTLLGWLIMAFAGSSLWLLVAGRVLTGVASGCASGPAALYCEEIAGVRVRGALGSYQHLMNCLGCLVAYALGALLPYSWFTASPALLPLLFLLTFCWIPESPAYLAVQGHHRRAQEALRWLRGPLFDCQPEIESLLADKSARNQDSKQNHSFFALCSHKSLQSNALRSFAVVLVMMFFQQITGMGMVTFYTVPIFQQVGVNISSYTSSIILGSANLIAVLVATVTVDRIGRRVLLLTSSISMGICMFVLAIHSQLKDFEWNIESWNWVPLAALVIYGVMFSVGIGPLPWFIMAELLPMHSKGWSSSAAVFMNRICMFLVVKESPLMLKYIGHVPTFVIFGTLCFLSSLYIAFCVPETKGKTKMEILKEIGGERP